MDEMGPKLPPGWRQNKPSPSSSSRENTGEEECGNIYGPSLPPGRLSRRDEKLPQDTNDKTVPGPALPREFGRHSDQTSASTELDSDYNDKLLGPALPPHLRTEGEREKSSVPEREETYGASLPPDYSKWNTYDVDADSGDGGGGGGDGGDNDDDDDDDDSFGPALPPGFKKPKDDSRASDSEKRRPTESGMTTGPAVAPGYHREKIPIAYPVINDDIDDDGGDEEDVIGPMPVKPGTEALYAASAAEEFERRANAMKDKLQSKNNPNEQQRESWMTELPGYSTNFGLGPRSFRKTARPEDKDRSVWTDTPADRAKKAQEKAEKRRAKDESSATEGPVLTERDRTLVDQVASYNQAKRGETLMDMHTKTRKRKLEEEQDQPQERRPFSREIDLQANRFDEAQRKHLIKKSAQLDNKFSHGKEKMFL